MKLFIYILFLLSFFNSYSSSILFNKRNINSNEAYDCINKLGMRIWTKIDLIKATNSTESQRNFFINELINDILKLHALIYYSIKLELLDTEGKYNILNLLESIDKSFKIAFDSANCPEFAAILTIISKIKQAILIKYEYLKAKS